MYGVSRSYARDRSLPTSAQTAHDVHRAVLHEPRRKSIDRRGFVLGQLRGFLSSLS